ncbi:Dam family site-specific DNA-(adenine-N6)-methyltransferase [Sulfitobacter litoralis]|uniref:DNA adenine methylase n=1 Tax=Sulfitobacter litoralis TaxID=335975 RepID=UPI002B2703AE|nr:Dam family site-specific DNA-(adenine-N6)-methyltransferase [Sulfitobacter litoralis]
MKPFIKWAGGKRWLVSSGQVIIPEFEGRYIEPFLGGGAVFFHLMPSSAILSDVNPRLIDTYRAVQTDWKAVLKEMKKLQTKHSKDFYYEERARQRKTLHTRAAQFLYLNRTCWNGLYRENLSGKFNVPIGSKSQVLMPDDDFAGASKALKNAHLNLCDFEDTILEAKKGDLVFLDPPYTTAHNTNGFVKYNQNIFSWDDQIRLSRCAVAAKKRGAKVILTNANHQSILDLYADVGEPVIVNRSSVISGKKSARGSTTEVLYIL